MPFSPGERDDLPSAWQQRALDRSLADARARSVERLAEFVGAARELAVESGSSGFTVQQVVARAGQSLKSFYRYFEGKDDLLLALIEEDCRIGALFLAEMVDREHPPGTSPVDRAGAWVRGLFTLMASGEEGYVAVLVREHRRLAESRPDQMDEALRPFVDLLVAEVRAAMDAGELRAGDAERDAWMILNLVFVNIHELVRTRPPDPARSARTTRGVAAPPERLAEVQEVADYLWSFCRSGLRHEGGDP